MKKLKCKAKKINGKICGHKWIPRVPNPKLCPDCKSKHWKDGKG